MVSIVLVRLDLVPAFLLIRKGLPRTFDVLQMPHATEGADAIASNLTHAEVRSVPGITCYCMQAWLGFGQKRVLVNNGHEVSARNFHQVLEVCIPQEEYVQVMRAPRWETVSSFAALQRHRGY